MVLSKMLSFPINGAKELVPNLGLLDMIVTFRQGLQFQNPMGCGLVIRSFLSKKLLLDSI
ncbi:hypothetical protein RHMOL_Rhmol03G0031000 [Rhododendron molle]|uniref:Uncharacterized protein n=1 Tax=Rhododendron molle TaxID=49168 RepID=A0ACC0P9J9_RHOML|nr:hypothetical protein RHMOL_Rhmol03G0031000 [Rhododendron molle]